MKTILIMLISSTLLNPFSLAQNLVPNWSFEDTVICPQGIGDIDKAVGWSSYRLTPEYFNSCNTSTIGTTYVGVPGNFFGYQYARTGNAYAGFYAHNNNNVREYIGLQLSNVLVPGQKYFVSFFVTRAVKNDLNIDGAVNKIGCRFSTIFYSYSSPAPIDNYAHVFTDSIISDTLSWTKISGSFIADSSYQYISVGNFFNDSATTFINYDTVGSSAYYFVDDIFVSTDSLIGISENVNDTPILLFPNPAYEFLNIFNPSILPVKAELYSLLGKNILNFELKGGENVINLTSLKSGVYFIVSHPGDKIIHKQFIKF